MIKEDAYVFSNRVEKIRKKKFKSQQKCADAAGISLGTYKEFINGGNSGKDTLLKLAEVLDVSVDHLLGQDKFSNIGNKEISKITGLSDRSIECLRLINKEKSTRTKSGESLRENDHTIEMLNMILEGEYDQFDRKVLPHESGNIGILNTLWEYCLADRARFNGLLDMGTFTKKTIDEYKFEFKVGQRKSYINAKSIFKIVIERKLSEALNALSQRVWKD